MAINLEKVGRPVCRVTGGKYNNKIVSVAVDEAEKEEVNREFTHLTLPDEGKFQQIPDTTKARDIIFCFGPSGSGKSSYTLKYLQEYKKKYKQNEIYLFSALTEDETIDQLKDIKRIKVDETLVSDPLDIIEFKHSCVVFDDIDVIGNKHIREAVYKILNQILELGRHHHITCIITNHLATNGKDTRRILNECGSITYFPSSGSVKGINYLLETYVGMDKKDILKAKQTKSRWITVFKHYPQVVMGEKNLWLLSED